MCVLVAVSFFFFFNDTATTEIYTLSLHDALPIWHQVLECPAENLGWLAVPIVGRGDVKIVLQLGDRKSTRLNSSHLVISYAVFCLKKKKQPLTISYLHHILCHPALICIAVHPSQL